MSDFLYWFKFWKQPKNTPQAVFQGAIGGLAYGFVFLSPLWITLLELPHD